MSNIKWNKLLNDDLEMKMREMHQDLTDVQRNKRVELDQNIRNRKKLKSKDELTVADIE